MIEILRDQEQKVKQINLEGKDFERIYLLWGEGLRDSTLEICKSELGDAPPTSKVATAINRLLRFSLF